MALTNWELFLRTHADPSDYDWAKSLKGGAAEALEQSNDGRWLLWLIVSLVGRDKQQRAQIVAPFIPLLEAETQVCLETTSEQSAAIREVLSGVRTWGQDEANNGTELAAIIDKWATPIIHARASVVRKEGAHNQAGFNLCFAAFDLAYVCLENNEHAAANAAQSFITNYQLALRAREQTPKNDKGGEFIKSTLSTFIKTVWLKHVKSMGF